MRWPSRPNERSPGRPLAYPVSDRDPAFVTFLDRWLELKKRDGTLEELYNYWILGKDPRPRQPRWSILRNVLGWAG
jgi:hypothetical protein